MASIFEKYVVNDDGEFVATLSTTDWGAQTFTIGTVGDNLTFNVSSVDVKILTQSADTAIVVQVDIYPVLPDGSPDTSGTSLSTGTLNISENITAQWKNIAMSLGTLKASTKYALVMQRLSGSNGLFWRIDETSPAYAGGNVYTTGNAGSTWVSDSAKDLMFQINGGDYAGTLCTLADARNKGGVNASSNATNESLVSDYVRQAEGVINAVTKFDWVGAYSKLTDNVKFILNQVASDLAGIYIITYDMAGYTADTVEAETMINVYREAIARGLSLLRNQEVKDFITGDS